jgi:hypothetical protein
MTTTGNIDGVPYIAIGNNELGGELGDMARCPHCGEMRAVRYGDQVLDDGTRVPSKTLAFVSCGEASYIVGIKGREITR